MGALIKMEDPREVAIPATPSLPRAVVSALTASEYVVGQGARWTPQAALLALGRDELSNLPLAIERLEAGMASDPKWLANRLTVMWLAAGHRKTEAQATAWLGETVRLLSHVPTDIVADAIDRAVMASERGFLPAVGEILKLAAPALQRRQDGLRKLHALAAEAQKPALPPPAPPERCAPEEAAAILAELGLRLPETEPARVVPTGPPRMPTDDDYLAMGISPEAIAAHRKWQAEQREAPKPAPTPSSRMPEAKAGPEAKGGDDCPFCGALGLDEHEGTLFCDNPGCMESWKPDPAYEAAA